MLDVRIGTAGWSIPKAVQEQFPEMGSHLQRYSAVFNAVEINTSFYRPHRPQAYARWAETTPDNFAFAVKVPKTITHEQRLRDVTEDLRQFASEAAHLGSKLHVVLIQLPPSLAFDRDSAPLFFRQCQDLFQDRTVVEPRHPSWFSDVTDVLLSELRIARVASDPAVVPAASRPGGANTMRYYRLHGSPQMYYSQYSVDFLLQLKQQYLLMDVPQLPTWCVFDNTALGAATSDGLKLRELMSGIATTGTAENGDS